MSERLGVGCPDERCAVTSSRLDKQLPAAFLTVTRVSASQVPRHDGIVTRTSADGRPTVRNRLPAAAAERSIHLCVHATVTDIALLHVGCHHGERDYVRFPAMLSISLPQSSCIVSIVYSVHRIRSTTPTGVFRGALLRCVP